MWSSSSPDKRPVRITVRNLDAERPPRPPPLASTAAGVSRAVTPASTPVAPPLSMGWLLRLFRSEFFDTWMAVCYLYRYRKSQGILDFLCNELYQLSDEDLEAFLPQVCNLLVFHARDSPALERFVMDKCASSLHFALQVFWFLQAAVEDAVREANKEAEARCRLLRTRCETAAVNGSKRPAIQIVVHPPAAPGPAAESQPAQFMTTAGSTASLDDVAKAGAALAETPIPAETNPQSSREEESDAGPDRQAPAACPEESNPFTGSGDSPVQHPASKATSDDADGTCSIPVVHGDDLDVIGPGGAPRQSSASTVPAQDTNRDASSLADAFGEVKIESESLEANLGAQRDFMIDSEAELSSRDSGGSDLDEPTAAGVTPSSPSDAQNRSIREVDPLALVFMKQERFDYFNDSLTIAKAFVRLSLVLRDVPVDERREKLRHGLEDINNLLLRRMSGESTTPLHPDSPVPPADSVAKLGMAAALRSVHIPLTRALSPAMRILRVIASDAIVLNSRQRVPYMLFVEVLPTRMLCSDPLLFCEHVVRDLEDKGFRVPCVEPTRSPGSGQADFPTTVSHGRSSSSDENSRSLEPAIHAGDPEPRTPAASKSMPSIRSPVSTPSSSGRRPMASSAAELMLDKSPAQRQRANVQKAVYGSRQGERMSIAFADLDCPPPASVSSSPSAVLEAERLASDKSRQAALLAVYGEMWSLKAERMLSSSPFRSLSGAKIMPFIVKAGDDLRQEQLAIQLISQFDWIFKQEAVDVYLRPFTVMSISSDAGLVEVIPDAVSVHSLKKRTPNFISLLDYFERAYGKIGSRSFREAQRRFIRSMAGYSLVSYFLQIKDRHNGNLMMDAQGHVIHIDFGFILTNSPGAIKFESVPFKLTEEYLQVMCARKGVQDASETAKTEGYRYFQELFVLGLLAARKHYEKLTMLVEIMTEGTSMPCMSTGHSVVDSLRNRFSLGVSEEQCVSNALALIEESRLSWRSASYDKYQTLTNAIQ